jgi:protein involved in polysaccharide export with SLBB domain
MATPANIDFYLAMNFRPFTVLFLLVFSLLGATSWGQAVLRPGDVFEVRLSGMPAEFAQEFFLNYTVSDDGTVDIPYIGQLRAGGETVTQFSRAMERKLIDEKIFTNPTVVLSLQPSSRFITIGGGVRSPGAIPWSQDLTLSSALKRAGGTSDFGNTGKIKVTRDGKVSVFSLKRAAKDPNQNPKLLPGDEVDVPE